MDDVEKVARALALQSLDMNGNDAPIISMEGVVDRRWHLFEPQARTAISIIGAENLAYIARVAELVDALERQLENMSFVLNRVDLHAWHGKFESEMVKDRELLKL